MVTWQTFVSLGFAFAAAGLASAPPASAQTPPPEEIIKKLAPLPGGFKPGIRSLRGIDLEQQTKPPSIDLYINFKYDSAEIEPEAMLTVRSLGEALKSPQLRAARIAIVGHTDGKGGAEYNLKLSERRAAAVRNILIGIYDVAGDRLLAEGHGSRELKDASRPEDGINRRVEIRNIGPH